MSRLYYFSLVLALALFAACSKTGEDVALEETQESAAATAETEAVQPEEVTETPSRETAPVAAAVPQKAPKRETAPPAPPPPPPAAAPQVSQPPAPPPPVAETQPAVVEPAYATVSAGTVLPVRLLDSLDSGVNQSGDTFRAAVDQDIVVGNRIVVPKGSQVTGKLTTVQQSGRVQGLAAMSLQLVTLDAGGQSYTILTNILSFEAESTKKEDVAKVGIGSGLGAVIGAIAGGGKGAAIGAAVGAGAGGATVAATRGKQLKYEVEHPFEFTLDEDIQIALR